MAFASQNIFFIGFLILMNGEYMEKLKLEKSLENLTLMDLNIPCLGFHQSAL